MEAMSVNEYRKEGLHKYNRHGSPQPQSAAATSIVVINPNLATSRFDF